MNILDKIKIKLPTEFLKEEVRCDYKITTKQKKIWAIELDLLHEILRVCNKHDIKIIVYAGTILGAIRHQGFIPWDDDIDVALDRENYKKLCEVAEKEFKHPYFFQTATTDPSVFCGFARLRNSYTTGIVTGQRTASYNSGIYIDVFVLDGYTEDSKALDKQLTKRNNILHLLDFYNEAVNIKNPVKRFIFGILKRVICSTFSYENLVNKYNQTLCLYEKSQRITLLTHDMRFIPKYWCNRDSINNVIYVKFENINIPVPSDYDSILKHMYGDYMAFPPVEKRGIWHADKIFFDPDKSYKDYYLNHENDNDSIY